MARLLAGRYGWASLVRGAAVVLLLVAALLMVAGCAGGKKLALVRDGGITAAVAVGSLDDVYSAPVNEAPGN